MITRIIRIPALQLSAPARGVVLMLLSVALFSINCLVVKYLGQRGDVSFWAVNFYRGVAGTALALFLAGSGARDVLRVFYRPILIIRGILGGIGLAMFYVTVFHMDLGTASVINLTYVIWGSLFAAMFLGEKLRAQQVAGLALAFVGVPMLCGFSLEGVGIYHLFAIGGAIISGAVVVLIRLLVRTESSTTIYAAQAIYGMLVAVPFLQGGDLLPGLVPLLLMLLAGALVAGGQLVMTLAYETLPVARGASIQLLLPVLNALGAIAFFGEHYTLVALAGGALVLVGSLWVVRAKAKLA
ncbi:MAG: DMT family transporter [Puniceicoccales bacterium]